MDQDLTPYDQALLKHLRREVDNYTEKDLKSGYPRHPNIKQDLDRSRRELNNFVDRLRKQGKRI
tara:strand:- start:1310 stop:1501 length:192 start_codon:yes stop_codon:yes gene_type:complete